MIFLGDCVSEVLVFVVLVVFYRQLCADVDSFGLHLVVDFVPSWDLRHFSLSLELSESSCQYFAEFHGWFGFLALDALVHDGVEAPESLIPSLGILQMCYFLLFLGVNRFDH